MNDDARLERLFADSLAETAPVRAPDRLRARIDDSVSRTRPRPRWLALLKEIPMQLDHALAVGSPAARLSSTPARRALLAALMLALTIAAAAATIVIGSRLLRDSGPGPRPAAIMAPALAQLDTWDDTLIPGLDIPSGMDVGPDGNLYVVNAGADEILVLSPEGAVVRRWGERGSGPGQFIFQGDTQDPEHRFGGIAVTPDGQVFVMDTKNDRVQHFDLEGTYLGEWGGYGLDDGRFLLAWDLADAPDGTLVIGDNGRGDVRRFAQDGTQLATIASLGDGPDGIASDTGGVGVGTDGTVYAADGIHDRAIAWTPDGTFLRDLGVDGAADARLTYPYDVTGDAHGNAYVSTATRIAAYAADGTYAGSWSVPDPSDPVGAIIPLALGPDGTLYASQWPRNLIHRLRTSEQEMTVPSPAPSTGPASTAPASNAPAASPAAGPVTVPAGLVVDGPFQLPFTADQPPTWKISWQQTGGVELARPNAAGDGMEAGVRVFVPLNAYTDACHSSGARMDPPVGPTVDDLVDALLAIPGFRVSEPVTDITIDGYHGKSLALESLLLDKDCPDDGVWLPMWTYDDNGVETFAGPGHNFHQDIAVLDVDGTRVLIEAWTFNGTSVQDLRDTQQVFDSIDFQ